MPTLGREYLRMAVEVMQLQGISFAPGLTEAQCEAAEAAHGFHFPPDLRSFLQYALPVGERFPDWRVPTSPLIQEQLDWPADGMCFDVEYNAFWLPAWGPRPASLAAAQARAREAVHAAPLLIPVVGHRYLPAAPCEAGNPVFSVYQTDIIYYGSDLADYLRAEFGVPNPYSAPDKPREIEFWGELERLDV